MHSDYDAYCDGFEGDPYADELAEEADLNECDLASLEAAHNESLLEAIDDAVCDALANLEVDQPLTCWQRQRLWSALHGFCNDGLFLAERGAA